MGLEARIWASRLGLWPQGQNMSFEGGGRRRRRRRRKNFPYVCESTGHRLLRGRCPKSRTNAVVGVGVKTFVLFPHLGSLPMLFFVFPPRFRRAFPHFLDNIRVNSRRLVTAFDLHHTWRHLLHLKSTADGSLGVESAAWRDVEDGVEGGRGRTTATMTTKTTKKTTSTATVEKTQKHPHDTDNNTHNASTSPPPATSPPPLAPPRGGFQPPRPQSFSLLSVEIPAQRSCADAGIPNAYCSCFRASQIDAKSAESKRVAKALVDRWVRERWGGGRWWRRKRRLRSRG